MSASPSDPACCDGGGPVWGRATAISAFVHAGVLAAAVLFIRPLPDPAKPPPVVIDLVLPPAQTAGGQIAPAEAVAQAPVAAITKPQPQPAVKPVRQKVVPPKPSGPVVPQPVSGGEGEGNPAVAPSAAQGDGIAAGGSGAGIANGNASAQVEGDAIAAYLAEVRAKVQRAIVYPDKARRVGLQGTVRMRFRILADGTIAPNSMTVRNDAAHPLLVGGAEDTLAAVSLRPPPLPVMDVEVDLVFRLDGRERIGLALKP